MRVLILSAALLLQGGAVPGEKPDDNAKWTVPAPEWWETFKAGSEPAITWQNCGCTITRLGSPTLNAVIACPKHREAVIKATQGE